MPGVRRDSYLHTVRASAGPDGLQVTPLAVDYLVRDDVVLLRVRPGDVVIVRVLPTPDDTGLVGATLEVGAAAIPDLLLTQFPSRRWSSAGSSRFPKSVACIIATYGRRRSPAAIGWPSRCQRLPRRARLSFRARSEGKPDRKSTRLNSSHSQISYAVFCLKKKKKENQKHTPTRTYTIMIQQ